MPAQIKSVGSDVVLITVYTRAEILNMFSQYKHLHKADIIGERPYLICHANCLDEATVLTALMCRAAGVTPACFHYDREAQKLYVCTDIMGYAENYLKRVYIKIIHRYSVHTVLKHLNVDIEGNPLFHTPAAFKPTTVTNPNPIGPAPKISQSAADTFHRERNFPFNTSKFKVHSDLTPAILRDIINPSDMEEPE